MGEAEPGTGIARVAAIFGFGGFFQPDFFADTAASNAALPPPMTMTSHVCSFAMGFPLASLLVQGGVCRYGTALSEPSPERFVMN
jgi:hypothetical protein